MWRRYRHHIPAEQTDQHQDGVQSKHSHCCLDGPFGHVGELAGTVSPSGWSNTPHHDDDNNDNNNSDKCKNLVRYSPSSSCYADWRIIIIVDGGGTEEDATT
jgi:hypothetical protein